MGKNTRHRCENKSTTKIDWKQYPTAINNPENISLKSTQQCNVCASGFIFWAVFVFFTFEKLFFPPTNYYLECTWSTWELQILSFIYLWEAAATSHRRQHVSVVAPLGVGLAVVARLSLGRGHLGQLGAVRLVMGVGRWRMVVLLVVGVVVEVGAGLLRLGALGVLPLLLLLLVLLLLLQPLLPLPDAHELDPPLLPTQDHWGWKDRRWESSRVGVKRQVLSLCAVCT